MNEAALYDKRESFSSGRRSKDYTFWGGPGGRSGVGGNLFCRYVLYPTRFVFKKYWRVSRVLPIDEIEKIAFWYSIDGGKAQVFVKGSDSTIILATAYPQELGTALESLGVKIEITESIM